MEARSGIAQGSSSEAGTGCTDGDPLHAGPDLAGLRRALPHPLAWIEDALRAGHYHFGLFEHEGEALRPALDRMALLGSEWLAPAGRLLDVGSGLGGTARLLGAREHRVLGLDPCAACVAFARASGGPRTRFQQGDFLALTRVPGVAGTFDGLVAIEVLQHFPELDAFLATAHGLLRPGARCLIKDVARSPSIPRTVAGFPALDELEERAERAGFHRLWREDLGARIGPTLPLLMAELEVHRESWLEAAGRERAAAGLALEALLGHMRALARAFADGHLHHEFHVLERGC